MNSRVQFGQNANEWDVFNFYATPAIAAGATFDTQKKVIFNGGVKFTVPSFSYTKPYGGAEKQSQAYWNGTDGALTYTSGLTVTPVKNLTIDCSWNTRSFYEAIIILIPKPYKDITKKKIIDQYPS